MAVLPPKSTIMNWIGCELTRGSGLLICGRVLAETTVPLPAACAVGTRAVRELRAGC